jgi:hypothetical protein
MKGAPQEVDNQRHDQVHGRRKTRKMKKGDTDRFVAFKENDTTTLISSCEVVSRRIKLDSGDNVG